MPTNLTLLLVLVLGQLISAQAAEDGTAYQQQIKPLLRERCYACHGALKQEGGLRLDTVALANQGGDSGPAISPGNAKSLLLMRVMDEDPSQRMPPEGEPLEVDQLAALQKWIAENAPAPADEVPESDPSDHWAFRAPGGCEPDLVAAHGDTVDSQSF